MKTSFRKQISGWGFLSPALAVIGFIGIFPFVYVVWLSLYEYNVFSLKGWIFTGLGNYLKLILDARFLDSLYKSILFVGVTCGIQIPLGLAFAILLSQQFVGRGVFRTILALPLSMAPVAIGSMWVLITRPAVGPISYWLSTFGITYNISESSVQARTSTLHD